MGVYPDKVDVPGFKRGTSQRHGVADGDAGLVRLKHLADGGPVAREIRRRLEAAKPWPQPDAHPGSRPGVRRRLLGNRQFPPAVQRDPRPGSDRTPDQVH
jgi:hypothetical protein